MFFEYLKGRTVLVTGGTGSFGQACVEILLEQTEAERIVIFSRDELKQTEMCSRLFKYIDRLRFFIGDVRDRDRLERAFEGVDYVIHAAALKQVPILEYNPFEAIKTNIIGTQNVIEAAIDKNVKKVLLISTDKAANPANLYGATKLCAEKLTINGNFYAGKKNTRLSAVRYGNVLGSRGSLLHIINKQRESGEVSITHEEMTRFWITLKQGVMFVLDVLEKMRGGEIFVPKIPSMKIKDFMISLAPGCKIRVIGIRPGEKMHEILVTHEESRHTKELDDRFVILPENEWLAEYNVYSMDKDLEENFMFISNKNDKWLDAESLCKLLESN